MDRKLLKEKQIQLIFQLEQEKNRFIRKRLIEELEFFEALGDREKGLLTAEQKLLILTPSEYREYKRTKSDVQISRLIGVSRSSLAEWKRKKGLNRKKSQPVQQEMIDVLAFHLDKTKDEIGALPASAIECQYEAFVINGAHN
ncbi:protein LmaD [Listeria monocytogenes]